MGVGFLPTSGRCGAPSEIDFNEITRQCGGIHRGSTPRSRMLSSSIRVWVLVISSLIPMTTAESVRVLLFIAAVAAVYVFSLAIVVRWLRSRGREHVLGRGLDLVILVLAIAGIVCVIYGRSEPWHPDVTHVRVPIARLAPGSRIRIVQISDVHSGGRPVLEEKLPGLIAAERPDVIAFTGDALNSGEGLPIFRKLMTSLAAIAPTFAVRGNWDRAFWSKQGLFGGTGVRELRGEALDVEIRGQRLRVIGGEFGATAALRVVVASSDAGPPVVALVHSPDAVNDVPRASLVLAGHTHGGQIRLPWYGALMTLTKAGKRFEAGLYRVRDSWLYVNRGIGTERGMPVRFLCRPEITVIDLVSDSSDASSSNSQ
jgi:predicted MPP superfamily phosphohydrolase